MKPSSSKDRFSMEISKYAEQVATGSESAADWLDYYLEARRVEIELSPPSAPCLEYALRTSEKLCSKARASDAYAQNLYAALCNNIYEMQGQRWHASWRRCGAIVAHMREQGDYIDWYCSGIWPDEDDMKDMGYLHEGEISPEISEDLTDLGWTLYDENTLARE
jgi:hypothetical protein